MRLANNVMALGLALAFGAAAALAGGPECHDKKAEGKGSCADKSACKTSLKSLKGIPTMTMTVGDEKFECPMSAEEAAKKSSKPVVYMIGDKKYDDKEKAMTVFADQMDSYVEKFAKIRSAAECGDSCGSSCADKGDSCCAKASKTKDAKVAKKDEAKSDKKDAKKDMWCAVGRCFDSKEKAEQAAKTAAAAIKAVSMKYKVGDEEFCCDKMAGQAAEKSGKKMKFVVGKDTMDCKSMARIHLDMAKLQAALAAIEKGEETTKDKA